MSDAYRKPFWISWVAVMPNGSWELHSPWWISGYRLWSDAAGEAFEDPTVCAAVMALSCQDAKDMICRAHDLIEEPIEWRFCEERPAEWTPFCDRFPRADWMVWP